MKIRVFFYFFILTIFGYDSVSQNFDYDIKHHRLELQVDPAVNYITGAISTHFLTTTNNTGEISFNLSATMTVDSVKKGNTTYSFQHTGDTLTVKLPVSLPVNTGDTITVYYQGSPEKTGFDSFVSTTHQDTAVMWTLSEPLGAKNWWPCKQIRTDKIDSIDLIITTPKQYKVAANGLRISETVNPQGFKITHWKHKYPIAAYLIAFAVTNYEEYTENFIINDSITIPIQNFVYPENLDEARTRTAKLASTFKFFCDKFMLYPFKDEKYGHAQFGWGGGMEHQTMTFVGGFNFTLLAHELAHQWFGNYITCGSWHEIWLNEGFAVYLEGLTAEQGLSPVNWETWKANTIMTATSKPNGSVYVDDTTSVSRIFDHVLTYKKGGAILHQLRWFVGDTAFFSGTRNYLQDPKLAYNFASVKDYKSHIEDACKCDLTEYFNDWYYGEGYPTYKIKWRQNADFQVVIDIEQKQTSPTVDFFEMKLPIKLVGVKKDSTIVVNNTKNGQTFTINPDYKIYDLIFDPDKQIITRQTNVQKLSMLNLYNGIKISPNPAKNILNLQFEDFMFVKEYSIYTISGKKLFTEKIHETIRESHVDITNYQSGVYVLKIYIKEQIITKKFIIP